MIYLLDHSASSALLKMNTTLRHTLLYSFNFAHEVVTSQSPELSASFNLQINACPVTYWMQFLL